MSDRMMSKLFLRGLEEVGAVGDVDCDSWVIESGYGAGEGFLAGCEDGRRRFRRG